MLKSMFLSSVRPFFDADSDGRAARQAERDKIVVTSSKKPEVEKEEPEKVEALDKASDDKDNDDKDADKEDDKEGAGDGEDDTKESDDNDKEEDKEEELSDEDKAKEVESLKKKVARLERRTGKTAGERDELRKANVALKAALEAKVADGEGMTEEEVERRANIRAKEIAVNDAFEAAKSKLAKAAIKVDKDFTEKINEIAEEVGGIPGAMIGILEDLDNDNGGAVLAYLANNPDDYEEIIGFGLTRMSNKLNKLSDKILEDGKVKSKPKSKVPPPPETIRGGSESPTVLPVNPTKDKESMEKFVRLRQEQEAQKRKARYG